MAPVLVLVFCYYGAVVEYLVCFRFECVLKGAGLETSCSEVVCLFREPAEWICLFFISIYFLSSSLSCLLTFDSAWTGPPIGYLVGIGNHNGDCTSQIIQVYPAVSVPAVFVCCPGVSDRRSVHFQNNKIRELKLTVTAAAEYLTPGGGKNLPLTLLFFIKLANIWRAAAVPVADMPTRTASEVNLFTFETSSCRLSVKVSQMLCLCFFACTFLFFAVRCQVRVNSVSLCAFSTPVRR